MEALMENFSLTRPKKGPLIACWAFEKTRSWSARVLNFKYVA